MTLHATRQGDSDLLGKRVLVTGCVPIGVLSIVAARRAGAAEIVTTDLSGFALERAKAAGADITVNTTAESSEKLAPYNKDKGSFDVLYECSGACRAPDLRSCCAAVARQGSAAGLWR